MTLPGNKLPIALLLSILAIGVSSADSCTCGTPIYSSCNFTQNQVYSGTTCLALMASNLVVDCRGFNITGSGPNPMDAFYVINRSNVVIKNCGMSGSTYGIIMDSGANNTLMNNRVFNTSFGISLSNQQPNAGHVLINNSAYNNSEYGFELSSAKNITFINNSAHDNRYYGIYVGTGSLLVNNRAERNIYGITLGTNNTALNNTACNNSIGISVAWWASGNRIENNSICDASEGLRLDRYSKNNRVSGNTVRNCGSGITLINSTSNSVGGNAFGGNSQGIYLWMSTNNTFANNSVYDTYSYALFLDNNSNRNVFSRNRMRNNSGFYYLNYAVYLSFSSDNLFTNNTNNVEYPGATQMFYSTLGQDVASAWNTGWWPIPGSSGSGVNNQTRTAWYNGTMGGRYANGTANPELHYWYMSGPSTLGISVLSPAQDAYYNTTSINLSYAASAAVNCWYKLNGGPSVSLPGCANSTLNVVQQGRNTLVLYAANSTGATANASVAFTMDTIPPSLSLYSPAQKVYNTTPINLTYASSDASTCWYVLDSGPEVQLPGCANSTLAITQQGQHSLTLFARDLALNTKSKSANFSVDTVAPSLVLASPTQRTYNFTPVPLNYAVSGASACWYVLDSGPQLQLPGCVNSSLNAGQGNHTATVYANDTGANTNSSSATFAVDIGLPSATIMSPGSRAYSASAIPLQYTVFRTDNCSYRLDSRQAVQLPGCANSTLTALSEGNHSLTIFLNNSHGLRGNSTVSFLVDTIPPILDLRSPANATYRTPSVPFAFTVSDASACWYVLDSGPEVQLPGCANATLAGLSETGHRLVVYANDSSGNWNSEAVSFAVNLSAPSAMINVETAVDEIWTKKVATVIYSVTFESTTSVSCFLFNSTGGALAGKSVNRNGTYSFKASYPRTGNGAYDYMVLCQLPDSPEVNDFDITTVYFDTQAPQAVSSLFAGKYYNSTPVNITYAATDNLAPAFPCTFTAGGGNYVRNVTNNTPVTQEVRLPREGKNAVRLTCTDLVGNRMRLSANVYLDRSVPTVAVKSFSVRPGTNQDGTRNVSISYTVSDNARSMDHSTYAVNGGPQFDLGYLGTRMGGTFIVRLLPSDSNYTLEVRAWDLALNMGSGSISFQVQ